jgi:hypothetical protein
MDNKKRKGENIIISSSSNQMNHAERYIELVTQLDMLNERYPELKAELATWIRSKATQTTSTRTGTTHKVAPGLNDKDLRCQLPLQVIKASNQHFPEWQWLKSESNKKKVTITWVVCYLNNIYPDQTKEGWRLFECSHRCIESELPQGTRCLDASCLCWESKRDNQSRGNQYCCKNCTHCNAPICHCQQFHLPPCK